MILKATPSKYSAPTLIMINEVFKHSESKQFADQFMDAMVVRSSRLRWFL